MRILQNQNLELVSARLFLRPLRESDVDLVLELFTDPEMMEYAGGPVKSERIRTEMAASIQRGADGSIGVWCICKAQTKEPIGTIALLPLPVEVEDTEWELVCTGEMPEGDIEIGYFLRKDEWGQGYVSEAVSRVLEFAFSVACLEEIVAVIDPRNTASRKVLERTGFLSEGDRRAYRETCPGFRIAKSDWLLDKS
ncbi:MAG: GNAT family N-acetyltransferase [Arenicellales bacterium]|nr:GNAT family N-acetyltransferase [Arenicellales bacterium]